MADLLHEKETYKIIGACIEVHKELGCGFLEPVYQEALELEFVEQGLPFEREKLLEISYKGKTLTKEYKADFICFDKIIVELKALSKLTSDHEAQLLNYLKATGFELGLLINFGTQKLEHKRMILTKYIKNIKMK
ncbi:MAG: GxxExxY protein [Ignavibacteriales bacterium]|nr:GxxExxY protein [Ignavibacteriales bacterium]